MDIFCTQARFVANATRNALPPPPPPPQFPGFNLSGPGSPLAEGPLGVARGVMPQGTAGPLTVFDPLPNALVNGLQNLMLPGSLPQGLDPIPDPVSSSVSLPVPHMRARGEEPNGSVNPQMPALQLLPRDLQLLLAAIELQDSACLVVEAFYEPGRWHLQ